VRRLQLRKKRAHTPLFSCEALSLWEKGLRRWGEKKTGVPGCLRNESRNCGGECRIEARGVNRSIHAFVDVVDNQVFF
jgi:hypothetical protein